MQKLYSFFPLSANVIPGEPRSLLITTAIYVLACVVLRVLGWALGWVPILGWLLNLVFSLAGIYCLAGLILGIVKYFQK